LQTLDISTERRRMLPSSSRGNYLKTEIFDETFERRGLVMRFRGLMYRLRHTLGRLKMQAS